jgi:preprotein translocase subunit SecA
MSTLTIPSVEYRRTQIQVPHELSDGADAMVDNLCGRFRRRTGALRRLTRAAAAIERLAPDYRHLSDSKLRERLDEFRLTFRRQARGYEKALHPALAALREAADRQTGLRPFKVQLIGALALYHGYLAEMATGEGKTLVACLAATIAGWSRRPCHVITVNDYLAQRDAEWFRSLYHFCGLRVGYVTGPMSPQDRQKAYNCDITYTTSKEILADFLRDRLHLGLLQHPSRRHIRSMVNPREGRQGIVMRGLHTAIVDEADSILIDEAVTPLIISQPRENKPLRSACTYACRIAKLLQKDRDYRLNPRYKEVELTAQGKETIASQSKAEFGVLWQSRQRQIELVEQALTAREFFHLGQQYVIQDDKVVIVDEFTGRMMPNRTWREGLHQAIEAKERLEISDPSETLSRLSFQRFFRFFGKLSGMTGTGREAAGEFWHIYHLPVLKIPTNRPCRRQLAPARFFADEDDKWEALVVQILARHRTGQPLLIGTRSVDASEKLATRLEAHGLEFNLLNATHHRDEARIIAEAGKLDKITIATNMAGRGTDIKLDHETRKLGGLHVIASEHQESARIDRQLFGRSGRQGDAGSSQAFVCLDDEIIRRFTPGTAGLRKLLHFLLRGRIPGGALLGRLLVNYAQRNARRQAYKQRQQVLKMDTWIDDSLSFAPGVDQVS